MSVSVLAMPTPADGQTAGSPTVLSAFFKLVGPPSDSLGSAIHMRRRLTGCPASLAAGQVLLSALHQGWVAEF